ncbi:hypothetical protein QBC43DRAFT_289337 [Cladorrhinum sp. PSN259]|nr:hypothetical protein QBC43DRAFT_289337 [Cladorrhinum sp. PSN259]
MPPKRKTNELSAGSVFAQSAAPPAKKAKATSASASISSPEMYTHEELSAWEHSMLVDYAFDLQQAAAFTQATVTVAMPPPGLTPEQVRDKARDLRIKIARGARQSMKWTNACRMGRARWSCSTGVASDAVVCRALGFPVDGKPWKQKKMKIDEFQGWVGEIEASIRYGTLVITGENVNVRWNAEENTLTVSGMYGLPYSYVSAKKSEESEEQVDTGALQ